MGDVLGSFGPMPMRKKMERMMKTFGGLAILAVFLAGCASQIMGEMVGKDVSQVVAQYGPPVNSFDTPDGRRAFQWRMDNAVVMPTTTTANAYAYGNYATGTATTTGGYMGTNVCWYTLYAKKNGKTGWIITGFEPPRLDCE
jgi:hypothetical protein